MDRARFEMLCDAWLVSERERVGIGTQSEKSLHAILKHYFEPDETKHEVKLAGHIADIAREGEIIEIQTKGLYRLAPKLSTFLVENRVTVVYPIVVSKNIFWLDTETGEYTVRKSTKCGKEIDLLPELARLREFLLYPNFRVCVLLLDANEYRALDGFGKAKKIRATKLDRIPTALLDEFYLETPSDYRRFLPEGLPFVFTSEDFCLAAKCTLGHAQAALRIFSDLLLVRKVGKRGRYLTYEIL